MYFVIGADLVPSKTNENYFCKGDAVSLVGEPLNHILSRADFRIFNLETPLADEETPIAKCGPNLIAPSATVNGYKALQVDLVTLANNHILDQGTQGLSQTCKVLRENDIQYFGAGDNLVEAQKPFIFRFANKRVGVYACAEHEFTIATETSPGANPFDPLESLDHIAQLKAQCEYVIVLYHGGKEHYQYPSPLLQKVCRKMVDKGADLVVCQHTHCIGCEEKWKDGTIVYGQGNFLFDDCGGAYAEESVLIQIDEYFHVKYIPLNKTAGTVCLANDDKGLGIIQNMNMRSQEILTRGFIENKYATYSKNMSSVYFAWFSEWYRFLPIRVINKLTNGELKHYMTKLVFKKRRLLAMQNFIECEAHRELLLQIIREERKSRK